MLLIVLLLLAGMARSQSNNVRGFYVKDCTTWLGNTTTETNILSYAQNNGFNYITLYGLGSLSWTSSTAKNQLASFISRAHTQYGIIQIGASGEVYSFFSTYIVPFNSGRTVASERFDVLNYEFEFWVSSSISTLYCSKYLTPNGYSCDTAGAFAYSIKEFKKIDSLCAATGMISEIYLGWPNRGQMQQIATRADRILLHAYRQTDSDVYQYSKNRLIDISSTNTTTKVLPIFSSEPTFMQSWLATNPVTKPYQTYSDYYLAETGTWKQYINLQGYQWFTFTNLPQTTSTAIATITASGPTVFCSGGSVTLTANSGSQYLWSPGGQTTRAITVSTAGSYSVRVTNTSGINATSSAVAVSISTTGSTPAITASGSTSFCAGGSVTLTSSAATSYLWSSGATSQSITVSTTGSYSVTTVSGSCSGISTAMSVNANSTPSTPTITTSGSLNICPGTSLTLTSSSANGYLWSTGATTQSIVINSGGTYNVRAYSGSNCSALSSDKIVTLLTAPATPTISITGSTALNSTNTSVRLTSSSANTYVWTTGETIRSITVTTAGSYRVTVTGTNGCSATSSAITVTTSSCTPPATPVITASGSTNILSGSSVILTSSTAGGYLWSTGATTRSITITTAGTYTVRAYSGGNCFSTSLATTVTVITNREISTTNSGAILALTAFPVPARDLVNFTFESAREANYTLNFVDITGRNVQEINVEATAGSNQLQVDISSLTHGIYFGVLSGQDDKRVIRLIVE